MEVQATPEANAETSFETLTLRERQVLEAITTGMNNPDIAATFNHLSLDTAKTHVKSILQKLRARNRTHAVVCALMAAIVLLPAATPIASKIKATKAAGLAAGQCLEGSWLAGMAAPGPPDTPAQQTRWGLHLELRYSDP
jgi:DNA-binding CsgD family transcriptional regulator